MINELKMMSDLVDKKANEATQKQQPKLTDVESTSNDLKLD